MPVELGSFSFGFVAGGAVVGVFNHFLAKSRDAESRTAKDFNEAADILAETLRAERSNPRPGSNIDFFPFSRVLTGRELERFNRCVEEYENAKKSTKIDTHRNSGPLVRVSVYYHDTSSIIEALDKLMAFTKRK